MKTETIKFIATHGLAFFFGLMMMWFVLAAQTVFTGGWTASDGHTYKIMRVD